MDEKTTAFVRGYINALKDLEHGVAEATLQQSVAGEEDTKRLDKFGTPGDHMSRDSGMGVN